MTTPSPQKALFLSGLGGLLEFYDFIIFALFASYISHHFFPSDNQVISLMQTFVAFSIGYLVRPLGGFIFGHFGDKYGRKKSFVFSIFLMALSTLTVGLLPTYEQVGISATIAILGCRILQGFSVGGEIPGAITYIAEIWQERKAFACSIIFFFLINGIVLGELIHSLLLAVLTEQQMLAYGWRIPFILGGVFGLFSYCLRKSFQETPEFAAVKASQHQLPLAQLFKEKKLATLQGAVLVALGASLITLLFLFTPSYLTNVLHYSAHSFAFAMTIGLFATAVITASFGYVADRLSKKHTLMTISVIAAVVAYPIFYLYAYKGSMLLAVMLSVLPLGTIWSVIPATLAELFPPQMRYTGIGAAYNIGFAIFGGLTPVVGFFLINVTGSVTAPSYYLMGTAVLAFFAAWSLQTLDTADKPRYVGD